MRRRSGILVALVLGVLVIGLGAGFAVRDGSAGAPPTKVAHAVMEAESPGTANGYVLLEQIAPNRIKVTMLLSGANAGRHPAHIHMGDSSKPCDAGAVTIDLSPAKAKPNGVIGAATNTKIVKGKIDDLLAADDVVVVHKSFADFSYISCGALVAN